MAALKVGDTETAKRSLTQATTAGVRFTGRDQAETALAKLK
jgi:hypothetical protein